ncbi:ABC transporter ATP-binding protein [Paenibacillus aceris]|uniref:ABC-2 type transport system ATP-binding protein/lipopolysaccharide transport system ATP-binding protein n=1 Tax=Paenibacillus aceris TaxID=869555 RepID=A0ABS4I328_9BACL|nr:ABC transporter ATP-binding protein [Paenibacillus aceris]MBP1965205.1 ABC-2 type transport system ATP-binding protein/lipopolysaccharide transport system ATP-binding protein [Paenibacillus aceris]NHW33182.1 ABC transporter ATP-binding protein [Paenibacillus aceris]
MSENIVEINDVSMLFNLSREKVDNIKEYFVRYLKGKLRFEEFWALNNVSFNIKKGESMGIVGLNGSGKSTLLKIIAGVLKPTTGQVSVYGSVAPLIELGAGFDIELTAKENIFLNGAILGYSRAEMKEKFEEILDFAELQEFVDVPIKNFSSGMVARLGFSIATTSKPDILIADEILGVGDYKFKKKCEKRMEEVIENGATVILVSHSIDEVKDICTQVAWLSKGQLIKVGPAEAVCDEYMASME